MVGDFEGGLLVGFAVTGPIAAFAATAARRVVMKTRRNRLASGFDELKAMAGPGPPTWSRWLLVVGSLFVAGLGIMVGDFEGGLLMGLAVTGLIVVFAATAASRVVMMNRRNRSSYKSDQPN
jgi:hypothetical protein